MIAICETTDAQLQADVIANALKSPIFSDTHFNHGVNKHCFAKLEMANRRYKTMPIENKQ